MNVIRGLCAVALGVTAALAGAHAGHAQAASVQSATSTSTVFQPIVLTKVSDLSFGTIVRPSTGAATVTIAASDGARSLTGSGALLSSGAPGRAAYTVSGEGGQTFSIAAPASTNMIRTGGSETLSVTLTPTAATGVLSGTLGTAGTAAIGVGGSVVVASTTASGAYTGTFNLTVAYN